MVEQGSGVILTLSASAARLSERDLRYHLTGGFGTAPTLSEVANAALLTASDEARVITGTVANLMR